MAPLTRPENNKTRDESRVGKNRPVVLVRGDLAHSPKSTPTLWELAHPVGISVDRKGHRFVLALLVSSALHICIWLSPLGTEIPPQISPPQVIEVSLIQTPAQTVLKPQQTPIPQAQAQGPTITDQVEKPLPKRLPKRAKKPPLKPMAKPSQSRERLEPSHDRLPQPKLEVPAIADGASRGEIKHGEVTGSSSSPDHEKSTAPNPAPLVEAVYRSPSLHNPPTRYPRLAVEREWEGRVVLRVQVLANGSAGQVKIVSSSGHDLLDEAAVEQVGEWHFLPAHKGEQPVVSWVVVPVEFKLKR